MKIEEIITTSETFLTETGRESYAVFAGLKEEAEFDAIFNKFQELFSENNLDTIKNSRLDEFTKREMTSFLTVNLVEREIQADNDKYLTEEARAEAVFAGKKIPLRIVPILEVNEPDPIVRRSLESARVQAQAEINPTLVTVFEKTRAVSARLGFSSYRSMFETLENLPLEPLLRDTLDYLERTRDGYARKLAAYAEKFLSLGADEIVRADLGYLRRARFFDDLFKVEEILPVVWKTLEKMGINAQNNSFLNVDMEPREKKSPRACCVPVHVPQEIYLIMAPHGGVDDYAAFLHEMGHSLHYAHISPDLGFPERFLGDNSITEAWAMNLEYLLLNPRWLHDVVGIERPDECVEFFEFIRCYLIRRYCSKLAYELRLHENSDPIEIFPSLYSDILSNAGMAKYPPEDWLRDVDSYFYCARYLRAWMLETAIRKHIHTLFGEAWYESKDAGDFLKTMWGLGQSLRAEEFAARLGMELKFP